MFRYEFKSTGKDIKGQLEIEFLSGPYTGVTFVLGGMKIADEENSDGSINMSFDYDVTNDKEVDSDFGKTLGDLIMFILEDQMAKDEVIYHGGKEAENIQRV